MRPTTTLVPLFLVFALGACGAERHMGPRAGAGRANAADAERARCMRITGNTPEDCDYRRGPATRSAAAAPRSTEEIRAEARRYYSSPRARCDSVGGNKRLDCLQSYGLRD